jgi:hypothetical protein
MVGGRDKVFFTLGMMSFLRGGTVSEGCISADGRDIVAPAVCITTSSRCIMTSLRCIMDYMRCIETYWGCIMRIRGCTETIRGCIMVYSHQLTVMQRAFLILQG